MCMWCACVCFLEEDLGPDLGFSCRARPCRALAAMYKGYSTKGKRRDERRAERARSSRHQNCARLARTGIGFWKDPSFFFASSLARRSSSSRLPREGRRERRGEGRLPFPGPLSRRNRLTRPTLRALRPALSSSSFFCPLLLQLEGIALEGPRSRIEIPVLCWLSFSSVESRNREDARDFARSPMAKAD